MQIILKQSSVGMDKNLIKHKLFHIEESSKMAKELLKLNTLTESQILVLDGCDDENSDEEDGFIPGDDDEEEEEEEEDDDDDDDDEDDNDNEDIHGEDDDGEDGIEDLIQNGYDNYSSEDDQQPTSTFENIQATSYSGVY
jgi:hypothetical protein